MPQSANAVRTLESMLSRYDASIQAIARYAISRLTGVLPGAYRLVYDNYNALVIAFSPTDRTPDCLLSVALYPRWVSLFFANGASLPDQGKLLKGTGKRIRHIVLTEKELVDAPQVQRFVALATADQPGMKRPTDEERLVIKSVVAKQRPRKPGTTPKKQRKTA